MVVNQDKFIAARKASDVTLETASKLAEVSMPTYIAREKHPDQFRLSELKGVYDGLNDIGKSLVREGLAEIFLP